MGGAFDSQRASAPTRRSLESALRRTELGHATVYRERKHDGGDYRLTRTHNSDHRELQLLAQSCCSSAGDDKATYNTMDSTWVCSCGTVVADSLILPADFWCKSTSVTGALIPFLPYNTVPCQDRSCYLTTYQVVLYCKRVFRINRSGTTSEHPGSILSYRA